MVDIEKNAADPSDQDPSWDVLPFNPFHGDKGQSQARDDVCGDLVGQIVVLSRLERWLHDQVNDKHGGSACVAQSSGQVKPHVPLGQGRESGPEEDHGIHLEESYDDNTDVVVITAAILFHARRLLM